VGVENKLIENKTDKKATTSFSEGRIAGISPAEQWGSEGSVPIDKEKYIIQVKNVSRTYIQRGRESLAVLEDINFSVKEQEFVCILGPSGCGKTTLLNILGGFVSPTSGDVCIEGIPVTEPSPRYVTIFQDYKLLPWRTVRKNIELAFEGMKQKKSRKEIDERVDAQLASVGLTRFAEFRPTEISGGMKQRVAIARALVLEPKILFMDEPFGALDAMTRDDMRHKYRLLLKESGQTMVMVTHDVNEAIFFADKIMIMHTSPGRIACTLDISLPENRDVFTPEFHEIRNEIYAYLHK